MKHNRQKNLIRLSVGLLIGIGVVGGVWQWMKHDRADQPIVLSLAEIHGMDYPTTLANERFAQLVEEKTAGTIQVALYNEGVLGDEIEVIHKIREGKVDLGRVSSGPLAEYVDHLHALMLPYLYKDAAHMWRVLDGPIGTNMLEALAPEGMVGLAWYDSGARNFYLAEGSLGVDSLKGKRIRVQKNSLMYVLCEALNAKPQSASEWETYLAVLEGSLDGAENNLLTYESYKQYEVCRYYILDEHTRIPDILIASSQTMNRLTSSQQEAIYEAAGEAGLYQREIWNEKEQDVMDRLEAEGVVFIEVTEEEKARLKKACEGIYEVFGGQYQEIIKAIEKMADEG